jgi:hypothetical protein
VTQAVPIDPAKLVKAARELAEHSPGAGRPRPIFLRRAVSTAYYALFHRLTRDAGIHLLPNGNAEDQLKLARTFGHNGLKKTCSQIAGRQGGIHPHVRSIVETLKQTTIADVAASFCDLQEARHAADYNHLAPISKPAAVAQIEDANKAIETLEAANPADRQAFFSLLAMDARLP